jgi:hypothetical protein
MSTPFPLPFTLDPALLAAQFQLQADAIARQASSQVVSNGNSNNQLIGAYPLVSQNGSENSSSSSSSSTSYPLPTAFPTPFPTPFPPFPTHFPSPFPLPFLPPFPLHFQPFPPYSLGPVHASHALRSHTSKKAKAKAGNNNTAVDYSKTVLIHASTDYIIYYYFPLLQHPQGHQLDRLSARIRYFISDWAARNPKVDISNIVKHFQQENRQPVRKSFVRAHGHDRAS